AVMAEVQPGEVIVLPMPEPRPVALVGELLATQAKARGAASMLIDAAVRDLEQLAELGLPIWARWVRVRGASKDVAGTIGEPVTAGGASIRQGDAVVLDADGASAGVWGGGTRGPAPHPTPSDARAGPRPRPHRARGAAHAVRAGQPSVLRRAVRDGGRGARGPLGLPPRLGR